MHIESVCSLIAVRRLAGLAWRGTGCIRRAESHPETVNINADRRANSEAELKIKSLIVSYIFSILAFTATITVERLMSSAPAAGLRRMPEE